jgi:hypothetical protein
MHMLAQAADKGGGCTRDGGLPVMDPPHQDGKCRAVGFPIVPRGLTPVPSCTLHLLT